jgi:carboxyl-terminal processing protease
MDSKKPPRWWQFLVRLIRFNFWVIGVAIIFTLGVLSNNWLDSAESTYESLRIFNQVLRIVETKYVEAVDCQELIYGAIRGMLSSLDPHSSFMPPDIYKEMNDDTSGNFGGIGIEIAIINDILSVVSAIEGTPAFQAGVRPNDLIVKIDDSPTQGLNLLDAVKKIRGPIGSTIKLTILRKNSKTPMEISLIRSNIRVVSIKDRLIEPGLGYIKITQFQANTSSDLDAALNRLQTDTTPLRGLVLDLRNNPGGLLDQAVDVSDRFLTKGIIVQIKGRDKSQNNQKVAHEAGTIPNIPMVVLIDEGSASAAEIVAGALQDQRRAIIMGTQSFGKGSVQTIIPMGDGSGLRLTTAKYYTPKGRDIQEIGITPDIVVDPAQIIPPQNEPNEYVGLFREKDLKGHLKNDSSTNQPPKDTENPESEENSTGPVDRAHPDNDTQLKRAVELLKSWDIIKGSAD